MQHALFFRTINEFYNKNYPGIELGISFIHLQELSEQLFKKTAIRLDPGSEELRYFLQSVIETNQVA